MFLGQYRHTFDDKGRLTIPARFRELLSDGAYILQGLDRNLMVFTTAGFEKFSQQVNHTYITDSTARQLKRLIFGRSDFVEVDRAGRILVQQFMREWAGLTNEAVIVGTGSYFEIWSPDTWAAQEASLEDPQANAERFAAFNLSPD